MSLPLFRKFFGQGRLTTNKTFTSNSRSQPKVDLKNEIRYINFISVAYLSHSASKNIPLFYRAPSPRPTFYDLHFKNKALRTSLNSEIQNNFRLKYLKNYLKFTFLKIAKKKTVLSLSASDKQKFSARRAALNVAIFVSQRDHNFDTKIKKQGLYIYMDPLKVKQNILRIILDKNLSRRVKCSLSKKASLVLEQLKYRNLKAERPDATGYSFNQPKFFYKTIALSVIVTLLNKVFFIETLSLIKRRVILSMDSGFFYLTCFFDILALTFDSWTRYLNYKKLFLDVFYKNKTHLCTTLIKKNKKKTSPLYSIGIRLRLLNRFLTSTKLFLFRFKASPLLFIFNPLSECPNYNFFTLASPNSHIILADNFKKNNNFNFIWIFKSLIVSNQKNFSFNDSLYRTLTKDTFFDTQNKKHTKNILLEADNFSNTPSFINCKKAAVLKSSKKEFTLFRGSCLIFSSAAKFISAPYKLTPKEFESQKGAQSTTGYAKRSNTVKRSYPYFSLNKLKELKSLKTLKTLYTFNPETNQASLTSKNLWFFLKKRHNQKSLKWIFKRYCLKIDSYVYFISRRVGAQAMPDKRTKNLVMANFFISNSAVLRSFKTTLLGPSGITNQYKMNTVVFLEQR